MNARPAIAIALLVLTASSSAVSASPLRLTWSGG